MPRELPILFRPEMHAASREKRKRQTRRLFPENLVVTGPNPPSTFDVHKNGEWVGAFGSDGKGNATKLAKYQPGDRLYVKEAWHTGCNLNNKSAMEIMTMAQECGFCQGPYCPIWYSLDGTHRIWCDTEQEDVDNFGVKGRLRSALFMPKWAARTWLEVTAVRAERLQDISEADAKAEGAQPWEFGPEQTMTSGERGADSPYRGGFAVLWDWIHDEHTWKSNPWVFVYEFKMVERK